MTHELVYESKIKREGGWLYYISKKGNILRVVAKTRSAKIPTKIRRTLYKPELIYESKITREPEYIYFINKEGNIMRTRMMRGRVKKNVN